MRRFSLHAAFVAVAALAALAACHGTTPYTPAEPALAPQQTERIVLPADVARETGVSVLDGIPTCSAKPVKLPGTYYVFFSGGNVKRGTFQGIAQYSNWESVHATKGTPPPTASPTASPTAGPTPVPEYIYYGTYSLKKGPPGCAYLVTTKSGKPFKGLKFNGEGYGTPKYSAKNVNVQVVDLGPLTITIKNLSQSGGSGPFTMKSSQGKTVNSGTVRFVGRFLAK